MKRVLISTAATAGLIAASLVGGVTSPSGATDAPAYTVQTLHFAVKVGPSKKKTCDIIGDLYTPTSATSANPVPAILTTNGFGGSKNDQAGFGEFAASNGYVVLSYSGLGFGGSGCQITLDDPAWDGQAASQLISYLGGDSGIAFLDSKHTQPAAPLQVVEHDAVAHDGHSYPDDPRVGMIGGSYGGEVQFAAAGVDPRLDTIVPMITWNDLSYSLAPNNANQVGDTLSSTTSGDAKLFWALGFTAIGVEDGLTNIQADPTRILGCPNFATWVCPGLAYAGVTGTLDPGTEADLKSASVATYMSKIKIPVLLAQGEFDTLFNLNEGIANYEALKAQGTPVSMIWQSWGHSSGPALAGEFSFTNPDPSTQYETGRVWDWFNHYLKDEPVSTGPGFAYYRDWVNFTGNVEPAYGTADSYGSFGNYRYYLGSSQLTTDSPNGTGTQQFLTAPAGLPTSSNPIDAFGSLLSLPNIEKDLPGTFASWTTPVLTQDVNVVGSPILHLKVSAPLSAALAAVGTPLTDLVLFVRLQDVAPNGTATDIKQMTAPIRVNPNNPFVVRIPAMVHQFAAGHQLRLIVAGGSINYRGGLTGNAVTIAGGSGQTLDLPSPDASTTTTLPTPPAPPTGPSAPDAPARVSAAVKGSAATISWVQPVSDGGSSVVQYQVVCTKPGGKVTMATTTAMSMRITGFANGRQSCAVSDSNAVGQSGDTATTFTIAVRPTRPTAMHIHVSHTKRGRTVHLWWSGSSGNGSKVTYVITSAHHRTIRVAGTSAWLYGLPKGRSAFSVSAKSSAGSSAGSRAVGIFRF